MDKITINVSKSKLQKALDIAGTSLPKKSNIDDMMNVLFKDGSVTCSNFDLYITSKFEECEEKYEFLLPGKVINIIKALSGDEITIKIEENKKAIITDKKSKFTLPWYTGDNYPIPIHLTDGYDVEQDGKTVLLAELDSEDLKEVGKKTLFAISKDGTRPAFSGAKMIFDKDNNKIKTVTSDTYRLSIYECKIESDEKYNADLDGFIVPVFGLKEAMKLEGKIKIYKSNNSVVFENDNTIIRCLLIDGKFPDFARVIPQESNEIIVTKEDMVSAVKRNMLIADAVTISMAENEMNLTSVGDIGKSQDTIKYEGDIELDIIFNSHFLLEGLERSEEKSKLYFGENNESPVLIKEENWVYLILPIKMDK